MTPTDQQDFVSPVTAEVPFMEQVPNLHLLSMGTNTLSAFLTEQEIKWYRITLILIFH